MNAFWVFAYGSLMWHPGFAYKEARSCRLFGYYRSLCIYSEHHRGTAQNPGLVLGLNRGGSCSGVAFYINQQNAQETYNYLVEREQINHVYQEKYVKIHMEDDRIVSALAFIANPQHSQYAGKLDDKEICRIISTAHGQSGSNRDYVINTVKHLEQINIRDKKLAMIINHIENNT